MTFQPASNNAPDLSRGLQKQNLSHFWPRVLFPLFFALVYASVLASFPLEVFKDRQNYLNYATYSDLILLGMFQRGWLSMLANEPVWLLTNIGLARVFTPDMSVRFVIFISAFLTSFILIRQNWKHSIWMIFFLLGPQVLKNYTIHLRQGLALSAFLIGYYSENRWVRLAFMAAAGFIHSSFLIISAIGLLAWSAGKIRLSLHWRLAFFLLCFLLIGLTIEVMASGLGARQGERYLDVDLNVSGLALIFWFAVLVIFVSRGSAFVKANLFAVSILCFYVATYFLSPISGRVFESGMLFVLIAGTKLQGRYRQAFYLIIVIYTAISYAQRVGEPWLGWATTW